MVAMKKFLVALPFLINKRKEKHPHNNGMKFHVQVRDIGSDQDNGIAMLSFANLLGLLPCQVKDWNDGQEREREWRIYDIWKQRQFAIKLLRLRCKSSLIRFWSIAQPINISHLKWAEILVLKRPIMEITSWIIWYFVTILPNAKLKVWVECCTHYKLKFISMKSVQLDPCSCIFGSYQMVCLHLFVW